MDKCIVLMKTRLRIIELDIVEDIFGADTRDTDVGGFTFQMLTLWFPTNHAVMLRASTHTVKDHRFTKVVTEIIKYLKKIC